MIAPLKEMASRVAMAPMEREIVKMDISLAIAELDVLDDSITKLEKEIKHRVVNHPVGVKLLDMPGEGIVTAGTDIGEVLPVARNCSEGKVATYAGLTPLSRRSGQGGKPSKLARGVNKHALRTNYLSAIAAIPASAIDAAYHQNAERASSRPSQTSRESHTLFGPTTVQNQVQADDHRRRLRQRNPDRESSGKATAAAAQSGPAARSVNIKTRPYRSLIRISETMGCGSDALWKAGPSKATFPQGLENPRRVFHSPTASTTAGPDSLKFGLDSL